MCVCVCMTPLYAVIRAEGISGADFLALSPCGLLLTGLSGSTPRAGEFVPGQGPQGEKNKGLGCGLVGLVKTLDGGV